MNRIEFMKQLESLLQNISPTEREEALQYYNDYFNDAGVENEQDVIEALGNPAKVAETIKRDLYGAGYGEAVFQKEMSSDRAVVEYGAAAGEKAGNAEAPQGSNGTVSNGNGTGTNQSYNQSNTGGNGQGYSQTGMFGNGQGYGQQESDRSGQGYGQPGSDRSGQGCSQSGFDGSSQGCSQSGSGGNNQGYSRSGSDRSGYGYGQPGSGENNQGYGQPGSDRSGQGYSQSNAYGTNQGYGPGTNGSSQNYGQSGACGNNWSNAYGTGGYGQSGSYGSYSSVPVQSSRKMSTGMVVLIVVLCVLASPILVGVAAGVVSLVVGIATGWLGLIFGFGLTAVLLIVAMLCLVAVGISGLVISPAGAIGMIGGGLICGGIGILFLMLTVAMAGIATPAVVKWVINLFPRKKAAL